MLGVPAHSSTSCPQFVKKSNHETMSGNPLLTNTGFTDNINCISKCCFVFVFLFVFHGRLGEAGSGGGEVGGDVPPNTCRAQSKRVCVQIDSHRC